MKPLRFIILIRHFNRPWESLVASVEIRRMVVQAPAARGIKLMELLVLVPPVLKPRVVVWV